MVKSLKTLAYEQDVLDTIEEKDLISGCECFEEFARNLDEVVDIDIPQEILDNVANECWNDYWADYA